MLEIKKLCNVLRGGDIHVIIIDMWIITKKLKNLTRVCVFQKKVLFLQGIFRAQASQMMILPWD